MMLNDGTPGLRFRLEDTRVSEDRVSAHIARVESARSIGRMSVPRPSNAGTKALSHVIPNISAGWLRTVCGSGNLTTKRPGTASRSSPIRAPLSVNREDNRLGVASLRVKLRRVLTLDSQHILDPLTGGDTHRCAGPYPRQTQSPILLTLWPEAGQVRLEWTACCSHVFEDRRFLFLATATNSSSPLASHERMSNARASQPLCPAAPADAPADRDATSNAVAARCR